MGLTTWSNSIRTYFDSQWSANGDGTRIVYDNIDYTPVKGTPYIIFGLRPIESTWVTPAWVDTIGFVVCAVMVPQGKGPEAAETLAELIASQLRDKTTAAGVVFLEPSMELINPDEQGWFQVNVRIPFAHLESTH